MHEYIIEIMICLLKKEQNPPPKKIKGILVVWRGGFFNSFRGRPRYSITC